MIFLLLTTGQTIIFLLRLVAADRRAGGARWRSATKTVGELEDEGVDGPDGRADDAPTDASPDEGPVRQ